MADQNETSLDSIIAWFKESIKSHEPIPPSAYLDAAQKLTILLQNLDEELIDAEMEYRNLRVQFLIEGNSDAAAETRARGSNAYRAYIGLKAKRERVAWFIQVSKKRVELQSWDL